VKKGTLTQAEMDKFVQAIDGAIIEYDGEVPPQPIPYAQMQTEIYATEDRIDIDRNRISGQSQLAQGGPAQTKTRTLGEIETSLRGEGNRRVEESDTVETFCEQIAKGLIGLQRQFYDVPRYTEIMGDVPQQFLVYLKQKGLFDGVAIKFRNTDIQCDYRLNIKSGSTIPMNRENRLSITMQAARFGQAFGLVPGSNASNALGKSFFKDLDMPAVERAYQLDLQEAEEAKKRGPSPEEQLGIAKQVQDLKRGQADTELKKVRTQKNKLDLIESAIELANPEVVQK
jgi:hypothetical protein